MNRFLKWTINEKRIEYTLNKIVTFKLIRNQFNFRDTGKMFAYSQPYINYSMSSGPILTPSYFMLI